MKKAEEYLPKHTHVTSLSMETLLTIRVDWFIKAINEARADALREAADEAIVMVHPKDYFKYEQRYIVDKESITDLIDKLE